MYVVFLLTIAKLRGVAVNISEAVSILSACQHSVGRLHQADFIEQSYVVDSIIVQDLLR